MLDLHDISLIIGRDPNEQKLLSEISTRISQKHFCAIVGPSGCGKSTLLKAIAGIREPTLGSIHWEGRDLSVEGDLDPHEVGYVPQFSIAYDYLTVWESVETALKLRVRGLSAEEREKRTETLLGEVGLLDIADRLVKVLSGGQKRRLPMAMEMVSSPKLLLVDEVTSGLDPKSEDEIVKLMKSLSQSDNRIVLSITHSLRHLALYDSIIVLYEGHLAYHGPPEYLVHYFDVQSVEDLFPRLATRKGESWHRSWLKHRMAYTTAMPADPPPPPVEEKNAGDAAAVVAGKTTDAGETAKPGESSTDKLNRMFEEIRTAAADQEKPMPKADKAVAEAVEAALDEKPGENAGAEGKSNDDSKNPHAPTDVTPGALSQLFTLLGRRWKIFFRDKGAMVLQAALMFGFPCLVVVFALNGLKPMQQLSSQSSANFLQTIKENTQFLIDSMKTGSLVSGLVMLQVILLTLIGSNNSAREIAAERLIFEKEKFGGVSAFSYVMSKTLFLAVLVIAQSVWMGVFVNFICKLPPDDFTGIALQIAMLVMVNGAMTAVCLGLSALMKTPEQASLVSFYLVGFQLPLSGAVLALPGWIGTITQPFIAAYWSWSGFLKTMTSTSFYDAVLKITQTQLADVSLCFVVLAAHVIIGVFLAYMGCRNSRWE